MSLGIRDCDWPGDGRSYIFVGFPTSIVCGDFLTRDTTDPTHQQSYIAAQRRREEKEKA